MLLRDAQQETFAILRDLRRTAMELQKHSWLYNLCNDGFEAGNLERPEFYGLREFLEELRQEPSILPPWWTDEKANECAVYGEQTDDEFQ